MLKLSTMVVLFLTVNSSVIWAQVDPNAIWVGEVRLEPGMAEATALNMLGAKYDLKKQPSRRASDSWWGIRSKDGGHETVGGVAFRGEKLLFATKTWADLYDDAGLPR